MLIAKIIKSNSHVDYLARVLDSLETPQPPQPGDYHFGQFVKIAVGAHDVIGVIYNSQLVNPEFGNYGPRLSTPSELNAVFSPDYLNEQGVLISLLLLGWRNANGAQQGVPRMVLPINAEVIALDEEGLRSFHQTAAGDLQLSYYAQIVSHAGEFAFPLLGAIADQLDGLVSERERARLAVLRRTLTWQQTMSKMR